MAEEEILDVSLLLQYANLCAAVYSQDIGADKYIDRSVVEANLAAIMSVPISCVTLASCVSTDFAVIRVGGTPIAGKAKTAIVVFRGTEINAGDILSDVDWRKVQAAWGVGWSCARGFYRAFACASGRMLALVEGADNVVVIGHSLGGALAQLAALYLADSCGKNVHDVVTFESPRVFDAKGAKHYDEKLGAVTTRVMDCLDPVCGFPPMLMGYRGVAGSAYLPYEGGRNVLYPSIPTSVRLSRIASAFMSKWKMPGFQTGSEHKMSSVIAKLTAVATAAKP